MKKQPGTWWYNECPINTRLRIKRAVERQSKGVPFVKFFTEMDTSRDRSFPHWLSGLIEFVDTEEGGAFWKSMIMIYQRTEEIPESTPIDTGSSFIEIKTIKIKLVERVCDQIIKDPEKNIIT